MNLIEKCGSYDAAKAKQQELSKIAADPQLLLVGKIIKEIGEIEIALLEYRRQHNIFEVGDKVIIVQKVWGEDPWDDLCYVFNAKTHHIVGVGIDISVGFGSSQAYRHATDAEIKAGKRLEVNQ